MHYRVRMYQNKIFIKIYFTNDEQAHARIGTHTVADTHFLYRQIKTLLYIDASSFL